MTRAARLAGALRPAMLVAVLLATSAGSAKPRGNVKVPQAVPDLPVPPLPPAELPVEGRAAPLPDTALSGPDRPFIERGVTVSPGLFTTRNRDTSDGLLGNSGAQTENERRRLPVPGLKLSVPIR